MKIKNVTDNFEIQELIEFPTNKQAIIHLDALHPKKHLLYYNEGSIDILTFDTGLLSTWRVPNLHSARQLKMNHDFLLLGVLISAKVLEIRVLYDRQPIKVIERDDNVSDFILGFEWVFKEELMVLCSNGIYLYKFTQNECSEPKKIKIRMNWYLYSPSINLLIVSTGTPNLFMYKLGIGRVCETYPNLSLMSRPKSKQLVIPEPVTRLHIHLFTLYGHHYIGHLSNAADETNLSLYRLSSKMLYRKELELKLPSGIYSFNVFDNLLLCHNLTKKTSMIFDVKAVKSTEFLLSTNELFQFIGDSEPATNESIRDSLPTSVFGPRNYIFSIKAGRVYTVELKLNPIMDNMLSRNWTCQEVTRFVLDRTFGIGSGVRFKALRVLLQNCAPLDEVTPVYNLLSINHDRISLLEAGKLLTSPTKDIESELSSASSMVASLDQSTSEEYINNFQNDIYVHVFSPMALSLPPEYMQLVLIQFVYSQQELGKNIQPFIYHLLLQTLIENKMYNQIQQLIRIDFIPDSIPLAQLLTTLGPGTTLFSLAVDMFKRLECHHDVIALLVSSGKLIEALHYARKTNSIQLLSPIPFLDHALQTGDKTLFLNIYKLFEDHSLIPKTALSDPNFVTTGKNGLARFVSVYREIWGPLIKMERI